MNIFYINEIKENSIIFGNILFLGNTKLLTISSKTFEDQAMLIHCTDQHLGKIFGELRLSG